MPKPFFLLACVLFLFSNCAHFAGHWKRAGLIPERDKCTLKLNVPVANRVKILYTGCGGLVIVKDSSEALITDPYYTGHHLWKVFRKKIDTANDEKVLRCIKKVTSPHNIKTVLVAHSHYDHLEDLPFLLFHSRLHDSVEIIGDSSTFCTIRQFMKRSHVFTNAEDAGSHSQKEKKEAVNWIKISPHMRVLVIKAEHAPHFYGNVSFMKGSSCSKGIANFYKPEDNTNGLHWKKGAVYSYLVDVLDDSGKPSLRFFIQSSSCKEPFGFPPPTVLAEKPVDIAFIGVASYKYVKPYPKGLLATVKPEKIVLIHWEDFFMNLYRKNNLSLRFTNMRRFMRKLRKQYNYRKTSELNNKVIMPQPLTWIELKD